MNLEKLVVPDGNTHFQMEGLSESKRSGATHELIQVVEFLEEFYQLFIVHFEDYISNILERKIRFVIVFFFFHFFPSKSFV
jgi:hypothetical protein